MKYLVAAFCLIFSITALAEDPLKGHWKGQGHARSVGEKPSPFIAEWVSVGDDFVVTRTWPGANNHRQVYKVFKKEVDHKDSTFALYNLEMPDGTDVDITSTCLNAQCIWTVGNPGSWRAIVIRTRIDENTYRYFENVTQPDGRVSHYYDAILKKQ